ncbi:hypothetical protein J2808_004400 [Pseudarthrobacter sulfonivorans]|nr:hypothetical protein [Pseudarthrobacter sulfonivorans]
MKISVTVDEEIQEDLLGLQLEVMPLDSWASMDQ